jgi:hypothetical protein
MINRITEFIYCWARAITIKKMDKNTIMELHKREIIAKEKRHGIDYYIPPGDIIRMFHLTKTKPLITKEINNVESLVGKLKYKLSCNLKKTWSAEEIFSLTDQEIRHKIDMEISEADNFDYKESRGDPDLDDI